MTKKTTRVYAEFAHKVTLVSRSQFFPLEMLLLRLKNSLTQSGLPPPPILAHRRGGNRLHPDYFPSLGGRGKGRGISAECP